MNPYFNPYNFQQYQPTQFPQMQQFQQVQPQQTQIDSPVVLYAPSAKEFANVSVQPGRQALVISQNDPYIAFKSADAIGMVQTTLYRLETVTPEQIDGPAVEYATKAEVSQLQNVVQQLIEGINKQNPRQTKKEAPVE